MRKQALVLMAACMIAEPASVMAQATSYSYDALGRLTGVADGQGAVTTTASYEYDPAGNRKSVSVTITDGSISNCSFAIDDAEGNDEFTTGVLVRRIGSCSGDVTIAYVTAEGSPNGTLRFTPSDSYQVINIAPMCCGTDVKYYHISISVASGSASIADGTAVARIFGNG